MSILHLLSGPLWQRLTWTLLHFLWEGVAVAVVVLALMWVCRPRRATSRYAVNLAGLVAMALCPLATFWHVQVPRPTELASSLGHGATSPSHVLVPESSPVVLQYELPPAGIAKGEQNAAVLGSNELSASPPRSGANGTGFEASVIAPKVSGWRRGVSQCVEAALPYGLVMWIAGVLVLALRLLANWLHVRWLQYDTRRIPPELGQVVETLLKRLGVIRHCRVCLSQRIRTAIVTGLWRPLVLIPASWLAEMTPDVLEAVIAHELAHVRRGDLWANLLQRTVETLLFYHPAVWWLSRNLGSERELCADECAVAATGKRIAYASALEQLGQMRLTESQSLVTMGMASHRMLLLRRVRNILGLPHPRDDARWWLAGVSAMLIPLTIWLASAIGSPAGQKQTPMDRHAAWVIAEESPKAARPLAAETAIEVSATDSLRGIGVAARCERQKWKVGDAIPVTFVITNQSSPYPTFIDREPDRNGGWGAFRFKVYDEFGSLVADPLADQPVAGPASSLGFFGRLVNLGVGMSLEKTIAVNRWAVLQKPGSYRIVPVVCTQHPGTLALPGGSADRHFKDWPIVTQSWLAATAVPLGPRPEAEWDEMWMPRILDLQLCIELPPFTISILPRSDTELGAYVEDLGRQLAAATGRSDRTDLIRRLIFTGDRRAAAILIEEAYRTDASLYWINEGLLYYLPQDRGITQALLDAAAKRGMWSGLMWVLYHRGCTEDEIKPLIAVSLAPEHPHAWADGAAAAKLYPDDRFIARLVALAQQDVDARFPARREAIYALALNRTDQSAAALRQLLDDRNVWTQHGAWGAVRSAWHFRHVTKGRPLLPDDFDPKYCQPY